MHVLTSLDPFSAHVVGFPVKRFMPRRYVRKRTKRNSMQTYEINYDAHLVSKVHELTAELEQLPRRAQLAAGFITYLSSAPEDVRKATMSKWCEAAGLQGFDFRRFMSTESEQLGWKAEGLPSDDLSMENALVILKVS